MIKNNFKKIISLVIVVVTLLSSLCLTSCKRQDEEETKRIVAELVDRSYDLNRIYYGDGLSYDEKFERETGYYLVSEKERFQTRFDLETETRAVFSDSISNELIRTYFDGYESLGVARYARYIEGSDGFISVYKDYDQAIENEIYKFDTSVIEIEKNSRNTIVARVLCKTTNQMVEIYLVHEAYGWRLDSPTY